MLAASSHPFLTVSYHPIDRNCGAETQQVTSGAANGDRLEPAEQQHSINQRLFLQLEPAAGRVV